MMLGGMRVVVNAHHPLDHVADELVLVPFHPLVARLRRLLRRPGPAAVLMQGRPVYRPADPLVCGDTIYCHPEHWHRIREKVT